MQCLQCGKEMPFRTCRVRNATGTPRPVSFCCYEHYLKFWDGVGAFVPLPEYKKEE